MKLNLLLVGLIAILTSLTMSVEGQTGPMLEIEHFKNADGILVNTTEDWRSYTIQSSTNLVDWTDQTVINTSESGTYEAFIFPNSPVMFYRAKVGNINPHIVASLNPANPSSRMVLVSTNTTTENVALLAMNMKSVGAPATISSVGVTIIATGLPSSISDTNIEALLPNVKLRSGSTLIGTGTFEWSITKDGGDIVWGLRFTNLSIALPSETEIPLTIYVDIGTNTSNMLDGVKVTAWFSDQAGLDRNTLGVEAIDANNQQLPVALVQLSGGTVTLTSADSILSDKSALLGGAIIHSNAIIGYFVSYRFNVTASDQALFISKNTSSIDTTLTGNANLALDVPLTTPMGGDTPNYYIIASGVTRSFYYSGTIMNNGGPGPVTAKITAVRYGTSPTDTTAHSINYGLQNLSVTAPF